MYVTVVDTMTSSYFYATSAEAEAVAELATIRKNTKYDELIWTHLFAPLALETMGPINISFPEFLKDLGRLSSGTIDINIFNNYRTLANSVVKWFEHCRSQHANVQWRIHFVKNIGGKVAKTDEIIGDSQVVYAYAHDVSTRRKKCNDCQW